MRFALPLAAISLISLFGCDLFPGTECTAIYAYGVSATVTDASTGDPIDNATLTLTEGEYEEVMELIPTGDYVGAGERKGVYTLTATAPGYQTLIIENIEVTADECHVQGVHRDVELVPED